MLQRKTITGTDLSVSALCYGTNMLGTALDQEKSDAILDAFAALGGNFIDTARSYGDWIPDAPSGASERAIGSWLKRQNREDFVIATKGGFFDMRVGDYRNRVTPQDIGDDIEASLGHLGVASIDLYWLHMDNPEQPVGAIIDAMNAAKAAGKIRWFGASNWTAERVREANSYAKANSLQGFVAIEPFWGLAKPDAATAAQQGYQLYFEDQDSPADDLTIIPYCGQSRGYFSLRDGGAVPEHLAAFYDNPANDARFEMAKALAERHQVTIAEVVLAYLTNQPRLVIPIFGASSPKRVEDSVRAASLTLSAEEIRELAA